MIRNFKRFLNFNSFKYQYKRTNTAIIVAKIVNLENVNKIAVVITINNGYFCKCLILSKLPEAVKLKLINMH